MSKIKITDIEPNIGLPGGKVKIKGKGFDPWKIENNALKFGNAIGWIDGVSNTKILTTVPEEIQSGDIELEVCGINTKDFRFHIPKPITTDLHIVDNPVVDSEGNIYATLSGGRGEETTVSVYKITPDYERRIYLRGIINATSLAVNSENTIYVSSRYNGKVYRSFHENEYEVFSQGLGAAFGLAFNSKNELYAGDRTGSIFKIDENGQATFFTSVPKSYIAFHLGVDNDDNLYVSNPIHMGENFVYKISPDGNKEVFYTGLSLFHGFTFDDDNNMYIVEGKRNESRVLKISQDKKVRVVISGSNFIGCTFDNSKNLIIASNNTLYRIENERIGF